MIPATALAIDAAALVVLALVPLSRPLGLADVEIPASAMAGWLYLSAPLGLATSVLVGQLSRLPRLCSDFLVRAAFITCACALALAVLMLIDSRTAVVDSPVRMRGFALIAGAIYALNLLALWPPFSRDVVGRSEGLSHDG